MMGHRKWLGLPLAAMFLAGGLGLSACEEEGPAEKAGEAMDNAAEEAAEAMEETGEKMEEAIKQE